MKRAVTCLFLSVFLFNFVFAASVVDSNFVTNEIEKNINSVEDDSGLVYWGYLFWIVVILVALYVFFKFKAKRARSSLKKKSSGKKAKKK